MKKLTFLMLFAAIGLVANATIRYIKVTGTGDGSSWENAAGNANIQTIIDASAAGDEVRFAAGTYARTATITIKDGVNLTGGYAADGSSRDLYQYQTILDGGGTGSFRLITASDGVTAFANVTVINGFILQRGTGTYGSAAVISLGTVLENCIIRNNSGGTLGAAVFMKKNTTIPNTAPQNTYKNFKVAGGLINCVIVNNSSSNVSAGVWAADDSHFSIVNCVIANNKSTDATNGVGGLWFGLNIHYAQIQNTIFYNNTGVAANNIKTTSAALRVTINNWFSDSGIPTTITLGTGSDNNKYSTDISTPNFANPTSFQGVSTDATTLSQINNSDWRLKSNSGLIGLGNSTQGVKFPYENMNASLVGTATRAYNTISTDVMGSTRVLNTTVEMGAYEYNPITITAATADAGMGSVSGTTTVSKGSNVTLTATPTSGAYTFVNWTNGATVLSSNSSYTFAATSTLTATANFLSFAAMTPTVTYARSANTIDVLVTNPTGFTGTITYNVLDGSDNLLATGVAKSAQASTLVYAASGLTANTSYTYKVVAVLDGATNSQTATIAATTRKLANGSIQVIDDFERGDLGWTGLSGGVVTVPFGNPTVSGINTSGNVAKISIASGQQNYSGIMNSNEKIQVGPTAPYKYLHLKFKRTADNGGLNLTFLARNDISQAQMEPTLISYATTMIDGAWYDYVFDLSAVDGADKTVFGFYIRPNKTSALTTASSISYIDDIYLSNSATASVANISNSITTSASTGGSVSASNKYIAGDNATVTATPNAGYRFVNWTLNTSGGAEQSTSASYTFTVSADKTLVANFEAATAIANGVTDASSIIDNSIVTVAAGAELNVGATKDLKSVTVAAGGKLTITAGTLNTTNGITLESTADATATILDSYSEPTITATVKQHVSAGRNWYLSSPVSAADYSWLNRGTSVQGWDEATKAWIPVTTGTLVRGKGYVQVATTIVSPPSTTGTTGTVDVTGTTNSGDVAITVSRTESGSSRGFNLVGNPYPSYLKWSGANSVIADAGNSSGISSSFWYRTKNTNGDYVFTTWNGTANEVVGSTTVNSILNEYIPPMQAFWVRVKENAEKTTHTTTLTFKNNMRLHGVGDNNKFKAPKYDERQRLRLQLANGTQSDEALIYFDAAAANTFDNYDSPKMMNNSTTLPDLYTTVGAERLAINGLNELSDNMELPLGFTIKTAFTGLMLKMLEISNLVSGTKVYLLDKEQGSQTELQPRSEYIFNTSTATTNNESRFSLLFKTPGVTTSTANPANDRVSVFVNVQNQLVIDAKAGSNYAIYNAVGMQLENGITKSNTQTSNFKLSNGVYVVKVNNQSTKVVIK